MAHSIACIRSRFQSNDFLMTLLHLNKQINSFAQFFSCILFSSIAPRSSECLSAYPHDFVCISKFHFFLIFLSSNIYILKKRTFKLHASLDVCGDRATCETLLKLNFSFSCARSTFLSSLLLRSLNRNREREMKRQHMAASTLIFLLANAASRKFCRMCFQIICLRKR